MAIKQFNARINMKRDTASNWEQNNPVLLNGEIIIVDTASGEVRFKVGDGTKLYKQLPFSDEAVRALISAKEDKISLTENRAVISDASGKLSVSAVTSTELSYLDGVSSNVQTQLNNKVPTTRKVNNKALSEDITLTASDVNALPSSTTYVKSINGQTGDVDARSDWNQNDDTKPDYVKNRPFYTGDPVETVLVEESTASFSEEGSVYGGEVTSTFSATVGNTYKVYWDGAVYESVCADYRAGLTAIGNLSIAGAGADTGEPFIMIPDGSSIYIYTADTSASHTFSISGFTLEVVKIDEKYLPDVRSDWNVNDETSLSYVKNRPFYTTLAGTELVNGTFNFVYNSTIGFYANSNTITIELTEGKTYKVTLDGVEYETVCKVFQAGMLYIGASEFISGGTPPSDMPFVCAYNTGNGSVIFATTTGGSHEIIIKEVFTQIVKIPEQYIPEMSSVTLSSSTPDSTKKFKITVDDDYNVSATNTSDSVSKTLATTEYVDNAIPSKTSQLTNDSGFITSSDIPQLSRASVSIANDNTSTINIPITIVDPNYLTVYQNGLILTPTTHYTATTTAITLVGYTADAGDIFTFVGTAESGASLNSSASEVLFSDTTEDGAYSGCTTVQDALIHAAGFKSDVQSISVNGVEVTPVDGSVNISGVVKSISVNGNNISIDQNGSASITGLVKTISVNGTNVPVDSTGSASITGLVKSISVNGTNISIDSSGSASITGLVKTISVNGTNINVDNTGAVAITGLVKSLSLNGTSYTPNSSGVLSLTNIMKTNTDQTMSAKLIAQNNTDYTTAQLRNVIISTQDPSGGNNGDIWIKYTV